MRMDMRPRVVARIMSKELFLLLFAVVAALGMPIYFLKVRKLQQEYADKRMDQIFEEQETVFPAAKRRQEGPVNTSEKVASRYSESELKREIERAEEELQREAMRRDRPRRRSDL